MNTTPDYATNLRKLRDKEGFTQEYLADRMGICPSTLNRIENNKRRFPMDLIPKLAEATQKSPEEILKQLNGVTVQSTIQENHGNGVYVSMADYERMQLLFERLLAEKDQRLLEKDEFISMLKEQLRHTAMA
jgi:transcriptional regulator with XRE-family HTH domain